jgi:hypothetical protein
MNFVDAQQDSLDGGSACHVGIELMMTMCALSKTNVVHNYVHTFALKYVSKNECCLCNRENRARCRRGHTPQ